LRNTTSEWLNLKRQRNGAAISRALHKAELKTNQQFLVYTHLL